MLTDGEAVRILDESHPVPRTAEVKKALEYGIEIRPREAFEREFYIAQ